MKRNAQDVRGALGALDVAIDTPADENVAAARAAFESAADNARGDGPAPNRDVEVTARAAVRELDRIQRSWGPDDSNSTKSRTLDRLRRNVAAQPFVTQLLLEVA